MNVETFINIFSKYLKKKMNKQIETQEQKVYLEIEWNFFTED